MRKSGHCFTVLLLALVSQAAAAPLKLAPVILQDSGWKVEFDPSTLSATIAHTGGRRITLSRPAIPSEPPADLRTGVNQASWRLPERKLQVTASLSAEGLRIRFEASEPGSIVWPAIGEEPELEACILPREEGLYIPLREPRWRNWLREAGPFDTMEQFSMPMWGLRYPGLTVAYILENPFDNKLAWDLDSGKLRLRLIHHFPRNQPGSEHRVLIRLGGDSPVEAARLFRDWYSKRYGLVTYRDKIGQLADAEKLLGAAHVYLWWKRSQLPEAPVTLIERLKQAGFDRLWLGADSREVEDLRAHPEAVRLAREYGYLFAPYDSYHSIHSPSEKDTWATAQFDRALYETGGVINEDGAPSRGFRGKGVHLSSLAAQPYVTRRVESIAHDAPFNSWFVDCDANGELFDSYSKVFPQTKLQDMDTRLARLRWISRRERVVVGSEGGAWYAASAIHFAHGMLTPLFGWGDPALHDPRSKSFLGGYWPPDGPAIFFKSVELPESYAGFYFDPRYRLPLFEIAFHDSVIATNHWSQSSLKFSNLAATRELLELLYGAPPLYHLNLAKFESVVSAMKTHYAFFSPLHREIGALPITSFEWLSADRLVQRTVFGGKVEITANFGDSEAHEGEDRIPPRSVLARRDGVATIYQPLVPPQKPR